MIAMAPTPTGNNGTRGTRVHVVSDVHGNARDLARAGDGADALICLGDLVLFLDYADHSRGIFPDLFGVENADRIVGLDAVIEMLSGYLSPSSIRKWLNGTNAHLGDRRPIAVLRSGMLSDVIAAIEAEKSGAYA